MLVFFREEFAACWHFLATGQKIRRKGQNNQSKPNVPRLKKLCFGGDCCALYVLSMFLFHLIFLFCPYVDFKPCFVFTPPDEFPFDIVFFNWLG